MEMFYDCDCDPGLIKKKKVVVIGYGSQGHAHSLNLKDSGCDVVVALRPDSSSAAKASESGLKVMGIEEAVSWGDLIMVLAPDEIQPNIFKSQIAPNLSKGDTLAFAHGLCVHFGLMELPSYIDVIMIAPKGPGHTVRREYTNSGGVPCLVAVHQDFSSRARDVVLSYACAIGGGRSGIIFTTFRDECETDLFGEQAVLCGGVVQLIKCGFETLVEAGYSPEMAYFECCHEMKLIVDLIYEGGVGAMNYSVSNTAEYGGYVSGPKLLPDAELKARMQDVLQDIQKGRFVSNWMSECQVGKPVLNASRKYFLGHSLEKVGKKLREMMPWISRGSMIS